jgi:hypothetical protein
LPETRHRTDADDLEVENANPSVADACQRVLERGSVPHQRIGRAARGGCRQAKADLLIAGAGGNRDELGGRQVEQGQVGEREDRWHGGLLPDQR